MPRYRIELRKASQDGDWVPSREVTAHAADEAIALGAVLASNYPLAKAFLVRPGDEIRITLAEE